MGRVIVLGLLICVLTVKGCSLFEDEKQPGMPPKDNGSKISQDSAKAIYRQFFFWGTHNTYSGNLNGMKREGIKTQLESGCCFYEFDLFSYYTQTLLSKTWLENVDNFEVFDYSNKTYLLSYSKSDTLLKAYLITALNSTFVCETTKEFSGPGQISLETLSFNNELFVLLYRPDGNLTVYLFRDNSFTSIFTGDIGVTESKLSPFSYNGKAYLGVSNPVDSKYNIYKLIVSATGFSVGDAVLQLSQVNPDEILTPFEQNNTMHIFRHNVNSVTSIKVETLITSGEKWLTEASISAYSDLLKGAISVSSKNGKLFINSYTTNGLDTGTQLVMDNGRPILVSEYNNEVDMLAGATSSAFPTDKGYYLFLQRDAEVQLHLITIGELILGHDAPGDEVDLNVDNPPSIRLADWIAYIANWSDEHPFHEPLFIMTELKIYEQWLADAKWQNIIRLFQHSFGDKLRYHSSNGFWTENIVDQTKIIDGKTLYFMDENGSKDGGLPGKVILYIQPNNNITQSASTNNFKPFNTSDGVLQENFLQLKRYRENNKFASADWRSAGSYGNDIGAWIDSKDNSYISRIFRMESPTGNEQYDKIHCSNVMFGISDRPFDKDLYQIYVQQQKVKNNLVPVNGCSK